jgi:hypothetical protein
MLNVLNQKQKQKQKQKLPQLDNDLMAQILSFCDASNLLLLLEASFKFFSTSIRHNISTRDSLSFSFLLKKFPNTIRNNPRQDRAIIRLLQILLPQQPQQPQQPTTTTQTIQKNNNNHLKYVEFSNLRNMTGRGWLPRLSNTNDVMTLTLDTLNLSGCHSLDPDTLCTYLNECRTSLRHLNLQGCMRVGSLVVDAIATKHQQLRSLWLGECSQKVKDYYIHCLLSNLRYLKHLDLQGLKHITDLEGEFMSLLPDSIQSVNFSACKRLRLRLSGGLVEALGPIIIQTHMNNTTNTTDWQDAPISRHKLLHIVLDGIGSPRQGLSCGILTYFALGRCLREIHLAGCEQVQDWEVQALAMTCGKTLTCFQMRACTIGNPSLEALAAHCKVLAECDVSACFQIDDRGILALCCESSSSSSQTTTTLPSSLKALKVASLPNLTNLSVTAMTNLKSLHVLDIHDCPNVTASALCSTILSLPKIIDVNAKGIADECVSFSTLLRRSQEHVPLGLRFVNHRLFPSHTHTSNSNNNNSSFCCSVRAHSQRLNASAPLQSMFHCTDCQLLPAFDRGMCGSCAASCHKGHRTFVGSWTRFYCDCPFGGVAAGNNQCRAVFPAGISELEHAVVST